MMRISTAEKASVGAYCVYVFIEQFLLLGKQTRTAFEYDNVSGFLEKHRMAQLVMALSMMALIGVLTGRRTLYAFTTFFTFLQIFTTITTLSTYLFATVSGHSLSCSRAELKNPDNEEMCHWADIYNLFIQTGLFFITSTLFSLAFLRQFVGTVSLSDSHLTGQTGRSTAGTACTRTATTTTIVEQPKPGSLKVVDQDPMIGSPFAIDFFTMPAL